MKKSIIKFPTLLITCCLCGFCIAEIDTSRNWNDTGIIALLVVIFSFLHSYLMKQFAWLWAIIIGGFVCAFNIIISKNYGSAGVLLFAFAGAYAGVLCRNFFENS